LGPQETHFLLFPEPRFGDRLEKPSFGDGFTDSNFRKMVVGSKVRMLHGMGEGIVTKIQGDQATVLLNEGLEIPLRVKDLVEIATRQEEAQVKLADPKTAPMLAPRTSRMFFVKEGVFLAGQHTSPMLVDFSVVNHTDFELFVVVYKLARPVNQFFTSFSVKPKSVHPLPSSMPLQETHHLVGLAFQILKHHPDHGEPMPVSEYRLAFSQVEWAKTKQTIPILEKEGYLLQLDIAPVKIDAKILQETMNGAKEKPAVLPAKPKPFIEFREVDLHIEKIRSDFGDLTATQMMEAQLAAFEKALDKAILDGVSRLILIHGVGAGVLKDEIHRRLGKHSSVKHFKDAHREKFGYGATEAQL
jgi:hypothetical protein